MPRKEQDLFYFDPHLPSLWSDEDVADEHLRNACKSDSEAKKLYDDVVSKVDVDNWEVPRTRFGNTKLTM